MWICRGINSLYAYAERDFFRTGSDWCSHGKSRGRSNGYQSWTSICPCDGYLCGNICRYRRCINSHYYSRGKSERGGDKTGSGTEKCRYHAFNYRKYQKNCFWRTTSDRIESGRYSDRGCTERVGLSWRAGHRFRNCSWYSTIKIPDQRRTGDWQQKCACFYCRGTWRQWACSVELCQYIWDPGGKVCRTAAAEGIFGGNEGNIL